MKKNAQLPLAIKRILRGDDALRAVEHGGKAVIVSNIMVADNSIVRSLELMHFCLVTAVGNKAEVLVDGGIRRGYRHS
jgi:4-hydroxymandelate oxidase